MSELSGYISGAFYVRSPQQIELDYQNAASGIFEEINFGPGDPLYQLFKVMKLREYQMEMYINATNSGLSVQNAYGDFLDKHGESKGLFRKGPQKAGGFVRIQFVPPAVGAQYNLQDIQYLTKTNLIFERETGASLVNRYLTIVRSIGTRDSLPIPYQWISGVEYINSSANGSGTTYDPTFNTSLQFLDWSGASTHPNTGATYYVSVASGLRLKDNISAENAGTGYNVGANTIVTWTNNASVPAATIVNNPAAMTGGSTGETDDSYRERILRAVNANFTLKNIRSIAEQIIGVRAAQVYQSAGTDRTSLSGSWIGLSANYPSGVAITGNYSGAAGIDYVSGAMWSQKFTPGAGIISLRKIILKGKRIGFPPPLIVAVRNQLQSNYLTSGIFDTFSVTPPGSGLQDFEVGQDYLRLDSSETYRIEFWCSEKTGASGANYWDSNYWFLTTTSGESMSGNLGSDVSGILVDPAGDEDTYGNLLFKTQYGAAAFNVDIAVKDGYTYADIQTEIDNKLDWVEGSGYAPAGVDYTIAQASKIQIYYSATIYVDPESNASFDTIKDRLDISVEGYVEGLRPHENVVYSNIYYVIMRDKDVWRIDNLQIWESGGTHLTNEDIYIAETEIAVFVGSTLSRG